MYSKATISAACSLIVILQYAGIWTWPSNPRDSARPLVKWLRRNYRYLLHMPLTFTFVSLMVVHGFTAPTLEEATQTLSLSITEIALILKILTFWYYGEQVNQFMEELSTESVYQPRRGAERDFWQDSQRRFTHVKLFYIIGSGFVVGIGYLGVLFSHTYDMPFPYYVPFDLHNPHYYWYAYAYEVISMSLTCISNSTLDMIMSYFLYHVSLLYKLIGMRLEALGQLEEEQVVPELRAIFKLHQNVTRMTKNCETFVSVPLATQITVSALVLCCNIYFLQQVHISEKPGQFFAMLEFLNVMTLEIFLYCYFANCVTVNAENLLICAYKSNWEKRSVPTRKLIFLYMEFLKRPVVIKAGNFFDVGLLIFTKTMNNAYSLCAVLMNMNE